jgi:hypothetical protein
MSLSSVFGGPPFYQATTTDPIVNAFYDPNAFSNVVGGGGPCIGGGTDSPSGNGQTRDDCLRPGGGNSSAVNNPFATVGTNGYSTASNSNSVATTFSFFAQANPMTIRAPTNALRSPIGDGHLIIIQPDGTIFNTAYATKLTTNPSAGRSGGMGDYLSDGGMSLTNGLSTGSMGDGYDHSQRSSFVPNSSGAITQRDINNGVIDHAMAMTCSLDMLNVPGSAPFQFYPAYLHDNNPSYGSGYPLGTRFVLSAANFAAGPLGGGNWSSVAGKVVGQGFVTYGAFCLERGGNSGGASLAIDDLTTDARWHTGTSDAAGLDSDMDWIMKRLQFVSHASCAGAGHPVNCPP